MNRPPGTNAIESISLSAFFFLTLALMVEAEVWIAGLFFVASDLNLRSGFTTEPEVLVRKTLSYDKNGEIEGLLTPTWQFWHSGRVVLFFFAEVIFLTL